MQNHRGDGCSLPKKHAIKHWKMGVHYQKTCKNMGKLVFTTKKHAKSWEKWVFITKKTDENMGEMGVHYQKNRRKHGKNDSKALSFSGQGSHCSNALSVRNPIDSEAVAPPSRQWSQRGPSNETRITGDHKTPLWRPKHPGRLKNTQKKKPLDDKKRQSLQPVWWRFVR